MHSRVERGGGRRSVAATVPIGKSNGRGSRVSGKQRRTGSIEDERDETGTRGRTSRDRSRIREQEARKRGEDDRQNCARARVGAHVHEWKGREVHAGAFIASARTCAMSSSAG